MAKSKNHRFTVDPIDVKAKKAAKRQNSRQEIDDDDVEDLSSVADRLPSSVLNTLIKKYNQ